MGRSSTKTPPTAVELSRSLSSEKVFFTADSTACRHIELGCRSVQLCTKVYRG